MQFTVSASPVLSCYPFTKGIRLKIPPVLTCLQHTPKLLIVRWQAETLLHNTKKIIMFSSILY